MSLGPALDADLGDALAAGRRGPAPRDLAGFERAFVAAVESAVADPARAWDGFYDATLQRVARGWAHGPDGDGTVATFTRIWARAAALSRGGSVLDVGTCFGFLPLAWSARPAAPRLLAADLSHGAVTLLARQARRLGSDVQVLCADGVALPLADRSVATVLLVHVLEHVDAGTALALLREACRVAQQRVVVAVPVEAVADPVFGHVQVYDTASLSELGGRTGWPARVATGDGAWLVLDRADLAVRAGHWRPHPTVRPVPPVAQPA